MSLQTSRWCCFPSEPKWCTDRLTESSIEPQLLPNKYSKAALFAQFPLNNYVIFPQNIYGRCFELACRSYEMIADYFPRLKYKLIMHPPSLPVTTHTSSPSACLPFSPVPILSSFPLLSCHSHAPTTKVPRCLKSPALISSSKRVTHVGSVSLITAWNHSGLTGREIKTAVSFTQL